MSNTSIAPMSRILRDNCAMFQQYLMHKSENIATKCFGAQKLNQTSIGGMLKWNRNDNVNYWTFWTFTNCSNSLHHLLSTSIWRHWLFRFWVFFYSSCRLTTVVCRLNPLFLRQQQRQCHCIFPFQSTDTFQLCAHFTLLQQIYLCANYSFLVIFFFFFQIENALRFSSKENIPNSIHVFNDTEKCTGREGKGVGLAVENKRKSTFDWNWEPAMNYSIASQIIRKYDKSWNDDFVSNK